MAALSSVDSARLGYAVLFSLPVGIGVSAGALKATGGGLADPVVVGSGVTAALFLFAFVLGIAARGSPNIER